jgi:chromosome segregation ATPase
MLDIREIQAIQREVCSFETIPSHFHSPHETATNKLNGVTKIVNGITQRFQQRLDHAVSAASTLDALQDRIVQLEKEIDKLKSDNDQLKTLKARAVADVETLKRRHYAQKEEIEQISEERDSAVQRLEKLEVTFRGCFSQDGPRVSPFGRWI